MLCWPRPDVHCSTAHSASYHNPPNLVPYPHASSLCVHRCSILSHTSATNIFSLYLLFCRCIEPPLAGFRPQTLLFKEKIIIHDQPCPLPRLTINSQPSNLDTWTL